MLPRKIENNDPSADNVPGPAAGAPPWAVGGYRGPGVPMLPGPSAPPGPDAFAMLKALRRRWALAFGLGTLAAAAAAAAVWFVLVPKQTATAEIRVASVAPHLVYTNLDGTEGRGNFLAYLKTQASLIKNSRTLLDALGTNEAKQVTMLRDVPDKVAWLKEELKVTCQDNSEIVRVSLTGANAPELVVLVNAVVNKFIKEVQAEDVKYRGARLAEVQKLHTEANDRLRVHLESQRNKIKQFNASDPSDLRFRQTTLLTRYGEALGRSAAARSQKEQADEQVKAHKALEKTLVDEAQLKAAVDRLLEEDATVKVLRGRIDTFDGDISRQLAGGTRPTEFTVRTVISQKEAAEKSLARRQEERRKELEPAIRQQARDAYEKTLQQYEAERSRHARAEKDAGDEAQKLLGEVKEVGEALASLTGLTNEIDKEKSVIDDVGKQLSRLQVEHNQPPRVTLQQEASLNNQDTKRQLLMLLFAPAAAFCGAALAVGWWEQRARRVQSADEVTQQLGLRVVGAVPDLPPAVRLRLGHAAVAAPDIYTHSLVESIDAIRTMLLRDASVDSTRVIMVTSAVSGEGKTTLSCHLADSLARAGRRTLLIDCDLRRPAAHQLFELPLAPGFSEALLGEVHTAEATLATPVEGLWMMPAGQWDREVMQALARDGVQKIFEKLRAEYDFVIIDSHPVLPATDSLLIGQHADAVILSLLRDVSQVPTVQAACRRLSTLGIRVVGAVVNGLRQESFYARGYPYAQQTPAAK